MVAEESITLMTQPALPVTRAFPEVLDCSGERISGDLPPSEEVIRQVPHLWVASERPGPALKSGERADLWARPEQGPGLTKPCPHTTQLFRLLTALDASPRHVCSASLAES